MLFLIDQAKRSEASAGRVLRLERALADPHARSTDRGMGRRARSGRRGGEPNEHGREPSWPSWRSISGPGRDSSGSSTRVKARCTPTSRRRPSASSRSVTTSTAARSCRASGSRLTVTLRERASPRRGVRDPGWPFADLRSEKSRSDQIGYIFFNVSRALALPLEALIRGKVCTLPSTSRVSMPVRMTEVATRT